MVKIGIDGKLRKDGKFVSLSTEEGRMSLIGQELEVSPDLVASHRNNTAFTVCFQAAKLDFAVKKYNGVVVIQKYLPRS